MIEFDSTFFAERKTFTSIYDNKKAFGQLLKSARNLEGLSFKV